MHRSPVRVIAVVALFLAPLFARAESELQGEALPAEPAYPLAPIDRPGILPPWQALTTLETGQDREGGDLAVSLALGLFPSWEATLALRTRATDWEEGELGLGTLLLLAGDVELDGRLAVPLHRDGAPFQELSLGPALSYTHDGRWVIAGFDGLFHASVVPAFALDLPLDVGVGYQPWPRLYLFGGTRLADVGLRHAETTTLRTVAPAEAGVLFAWDRRLDVGLVASDGDLWHPREDYRVSLLVTWKATR